MGRAGGNTGGEGAGAPTIHRAMTRRPIHTGRVIATRLASTRETQTQSSRPTRRAGNHLGRTYGWKPIGPSRCRSAWWAAPRSGCWGSSMTAGPGSSPWSRSRYDWRSKSQATTRHQPRIRALSQVRVWDCSSSAGRITWSSNSSSESSLIWKEDEVSFSIVVYLININSFISILNKVTLYL